MVGTHAEASGADVHGQPDQHCGRADAGQRQRIATVGATPDPRISHAKNPASPASPASSAPAAAPPGDPASPASPDEHAASPAHRPDVALSMPLLGRGRGRDRGDSGDRGGRKSDRDAPGPGRGGSAEAHRPPPRLPPPASLLPRSATRARCLAAVLGASLLLLFLLLLGLAAPSSQLRAGLLGKAQGWGLTVPLDAKIRSHTTPEYEHLFNPDDLTFTGEECDAYFPRLFQEVDRSREYYAKHPLTKEYLELSCDEPGVTHLRVKIYRNRLYVAHHEQSEFTRTQAILGLLHQSISTSREPLPDVEFCIGAGDWPGRGKFSSTRAPEMQDAWLMPDYGFFSRPEDVGSYHDLRRRMDLVERNVSWDQKVAKLFWRGTTDVDQAYREAMLRAARGHEWSDVKALSQATEQIPIKMEDQCRWKFQAVPEGDSYSGPLPYLQNCKTVIVTHQPRWLQHWTHLLNADDDSPEQNVVFIPFASPARPLLRALLPDHKETSGLSRPEFRDASTHGVLARGRDRTRPSALSTEDALWARLPETMQRLLADDRRARAIADTQWAFFRSRYLSPASATCYWRRAIQAYASVQHFTVDLSGKETSYESWLLRGMRDRTWRQGVQR